MNTHSAMPIQPAAQPRTPPSVPTLHSRRSVYLESDGAVESEQLQQWARRGITSLVVRNEITPDSDVLGHVKLLRDAAGQRIRVIWSGSLGLPLEPISHLDAPLYGGEVPTPPKNRLWYRNGPDFVLIEREQTEGSAENEDFVLHDEPEVTAFRMAQRPVRLESLDAAMRAAFGHLLDKRLMVTRGGYGIATPARLQRWPHRGPVPPIETHANA